MQSTPPHFLIRPALSEELPQLPPIEEAADAIFPPGRLPEVNETHPLEQLASSLSAGLLFVAQWCSPAEVVGFSVCSIRGALLHLHQVSVLPACGRRGIGRALVQAQLQACVRLGYYGVTLNTFEDIPWNAPFYRSLGFEILLEEEILPAHKTSIEKAKALGMVNRVPMIFRV